MRRNFFKMGLAAALTLTGIAVVAPQKPVNAATTKAPIKRVQINYLSGKSVKIWTNYEGGQLIAFRAKNNTKWNVAATAVDSKGNLWYKVGINEWLEAKYTVDLTGNTAAKKSKVQLRTLVKKPKKSSQIRILKHKPTKAKSIAKPKPAAEAAVPVNSGNKQKEQAVVGLAKNQVGKSYAWGSNGPDTFDCSGLVQYVYQQAGGVNLPRVTTDQVKVGTTVQMSQLQPGDLLFWGSTAAPYHVAIYVGNKQYVSAATPDQGVVLQTLSSYFYPCVAKRVL
ncbi:C40 family peptidase [Lactobacillus sp. ESL0785]|uniref:C40 family peptidase n=1 Tax=Lactobacillus sp. ESL0785 TaxID=2983232 RepID=UPI0023F8E008|nr:C40 family peptidase [Lactobacillus sp. ESL0785]WEV70676.1 C40 family peptidase [Lactobacillus sp. ESL0785]